MAHGDISLLLI